MIDDGDAGSGRRLELGPEPPRRGVGVDREQETSPPGAGVRGVDPGVRADQPAVRLDDQDALAADDPPALAEDQLDQRRVLVEPGGELARALARLDVGQRAAPSLGLRDDLLRDRDDVAVAKLGAAGDQLAEPVAGPDLGQPSTGSSSIALMPAPADRASASAAAVPARAPDRRASSRRARQVVGGVEVEGERGELARPAAPPPPRRASSRWRSRLPGPKAGPIASGGASSSPLVPVPWRSGTTPATGAAAPRGPRSSSTASSSGQSPGSSAAQLAPARQRRVHSERRGLGVAGVVGVVDDLDAHGPRQLRGAAGSPLTTSSALDPLAAAERGEDVGEHRRGQLAALGVGERLAEPRLGGARSA